MRGQGQPCDRLQREPVEARLPHALLGDWDVLWQACEETDTTVSMHIGSSSSMPTTSPDAPLATSMSLYAHNAQASLADWIFSQTLSRFPKPEDRVRREPGWMDALPARAHGQRCGATGSVVSSSPVAPSEQVKGRVWSCIFDDLTGLKNRHEMGTEMIVFETDYPHSDGTFPHSRKVAHELFSRAGMNAEECRMVLRTNAITCYGLERFGITE